MDVSDEKMFQRVELRQVKLRAMGGEKGENLLKKKKKVNNEP